MATVVVRQVRGRAEGVLVVVVGAAVSDAEVVEAEGGVLGLVVPGEGLVGVCVALF